jgi:phosphoglycerol transferase MdoB-like AlkP superfamily enzyme
MSPKMARMGTRVIDSIRPQVLTDDENFNQIVRETSYIKPRHELVAFGVGALVGLLLALSGSGATFSWFTVSWLLLTCLADGLIAWAIYASLVSTRLMTALLRQPLRVDPFDITPFEPIGRQSLLISLVFVGGITISLIFVALDPQSFRLLVFWLTYIPLVMVPVVIFFLNMHPTHKVLAEARAHEMGAVQQHIQEACRKLVKKLDEDQDTEKLTVEINALVVYEQRLQAARTWPYNIPMLRALFFSVLIPVGATLARMAFEKLFR